MGLFDKKDKKKKGKQDEFDSPVEQIDLSAPDPAPPPQAAAPPSSEPRTIEAEPPPPSVSARAPRRHEPEPDDFDAPSYGINKAIELMRTLPTDNIELVVTVIKHTLESTKIKITDIIEDATHKQDDIEGRIKVLKTEIAEFESEIATRREEIAGLEADYTETTQVKEHLQLAEKLDKPTSPASPPAGGMGGAAGKTTSSGGADRAKASGSIGTPGGPPGASRGAISGNHPIGAPGAPKKPPLSGPSTKTTVVAKK